MFLKLRIIFTILSALCAALVLPIGTWFGLVWAIVAAVAAAVFFFIMLIFKQEQEKRETPIEKEPDFLNPNKPDEQEK